MRKKLMMRVRETIFIQSTLQNLKDFSLNPSLIIQIKGSNW